MGEVEALKGGEAGNKSGKWARQIVREEEETFELGGVEKVGWDGAEEVVMVEV